MRRCTVLLAGAALAGCSMTPAYVRPEAPVAPGWPVGDAYLAQTEAALPIVSYRDVFRDARLQRLIEQALANNRDLRIAAANIAQARAQYRIQRADRFPQIDASASGRYSDNGTSTSTTTAGGGGTGAGDGTGTGTGGTTVTTVRRAGSNFTADVGTTAFELDLFGRIAALTQAERNRLFATEAAARTVRLTLVADIADAWATYAADASLLRIARQTASNAERSVALTRARLQGGIAPRTDLRQAEQVLETARADLAEQRTALAQDVNLLRLLVGAEVDPALLPAAIGEATAAVGEVPAGLSSQVLLRRPDVVEAEYSLRAANAEIGAARAALFPTITLTGILGFASEALTGLFSGDGFNYSAGGAVNYPIFRAGAGRAGVAFTRAQRDAAVATYEQTIQTAFREVADALARRGTIDEQRRATQAQRDAAADTYRLTDARYRGGIDTFLASLDAQRSLYTAEREVVAVELARAAAFVDLYRSLGGDQLVTATDRGPEPDAAATPPPS